MMEVVNLSELPALTKDINRADWVSNAAVKVVDGEVEYRDPSGSLICLTNEMSHLMSSNATEALLIKWIQGAECCDARDELRERLIFIVECQLQGCAEKYGIGAA